MVNTDITTVVSVFAAVGGLVVSLFAYVGYQKSRDRQRAIRKAFDDVIEFLASNNEEHRLAGAILLRRFFDKKSEFGLRTWWWPIKKRAPYAQEAINVTAAVLRGTETCNFQKLLADGLAYAHDLKDVDLQKTNLQNAYLSTERKDKRFNLGGADFYRADLRRASLKGSIVTGGVFYKAILCETVFERADLTGADFTGAILTGAKFEGAELRGAKFKDARNVPQELLAFLDEDDTYNSDQLGQNGQAIRQPSRELPVPLVYSSAFLHTSPWSNRRTSSTSPGCLISMASLPKNYPGASTLSLAN